MRQAGAAGETISGTKVTSEGRTGEVVDAKMEKGYNVFTIEWLRGKGDKRSAYATKDMLRSRECGQGVVSFDEANEKMRVFLLANLSMVNVQVHKFITNDGNEQNVNYTCNLTGAKGQEIRSGRRYAWEETKKAGEVDMLVENEVKFLESAEDKKAW